MVLGASQATRAMLRASLVPNPHCALGAAFQTRKVQRNFRLLRFPNCTAERVFSAASFAFAAQLWVSVSGCVGPGHTEAVVQPNYVDRCAYLHPFANQTLLSPPHPSHSAQFGCSFAQFLGGDIFQRSTLSVASQVRQVVVFAQRRTPTVAALVTDRTNTIVFRSPRSVRPVLDSDTRSWVTWVKLVLSEIPTHRFEVQWKDALSPGTYLTRCNIRKDGWTICLSAVCHINVLISIYADAKCSFPGGFMRLRYRWLCTRVGLHINPGSACEYCGVKCE